MIYIGEVIDIVDPNGGDRIKVRLLPADKWKTEEQIEYAFPLLPKLFHIKPKVGEAVLVICAVDGLQETQRYYLGPIISQPQNMYYDDYQFGATNLLKRGLGKPKKTIDDFSEANGALAKPDETAIYSRQNTDIILSNNDIRIRCGAKLINPSINNQTGDNIVFNKNNPGFIKLKYHDTPFINPLQPRTQSKSTITAVADEINLLSNKSSEAFETTNTNGQITDETMAKIINEAHVLPYGDVLVDFLMAFLQMFKAHTHKYAGDRPCPDSYSQFMDETFGRCGRKVEQDDNLEVIGGGTPIEMVNNTFRGLYDKLLSKNVRIN